MRNAFWHLTADPASPFSEHFFLPEGRRGDLTHPNPRGHEYLAQMAAYWVEKALQEQLAEDGLLEPEPAALGPPMWAGNYERNGTLCFIDEELGRIVAGKAGFEWRVEGRPEKPKPRGGVQRCHLPLGELELGGDGRHGGSHAGPCIRRRGGRRRGPRCSRQR